MKKSTNTAKATKTTTKMAKTAKAAPAKAIKPKTEKPKAPAKAARAVKVEKANDAEPKASKRPGPMLLKASLKATKAKTEKVQKPEAPKAELTVKVKKLDEQTKTLNALTRRYVYLANALDRKQMLEAKTPATMIVSMESTLKAFEDDRQLGTWIHAVPLLAKDASPAEHKAAVLRADRGRSFRRKVRSWIEDARRFVAEQKNAAR